MRLYQSLSDPGLAESLKYGGVGIIPTDTVYGLVACAKNRLAVEELYETKPRRPQPGTIIGANLEQFVELGFDRDELERAREHWPGKTSVVLDASNLPIYLRADRDSLPLRIPDVPALVKLLEVTGPLMTTSANPPDRPTATNFIQIKSYFGDKLDFVVDAGEISGDQPSSIISFDKKGKVIRHR